MSRSSRGASPTYTFAVLPASLQESMRTIWYEHSRRLSGTGSALPVLCQPVEWHTLPRDEATAGVCLLQVAGPYSPDAEAMWRTARGALLSACAAYGITAVIPPPIWVRPMSQRSASRRASAL